MKLLTTITAAAILGLSMASSVQAAPAVYFKNPVSWAGTGCTAGSSGGINNAVTVQGANSQTLSILFARFDAGSNSVSGLMRSACSFVIPIKIPRGFQISRLTADWEGFVEGRGQLKRKFFLAGSPYTGWRTNNFNMPNGNNFTKRDNLYHASFSSQCNGGTFNLRINSQIRALTPSSYAAVDSADLKNRILFRLQYLPCS